MRSGVRDAASEMAQGLLHSCILLEGECSSRHARRSGPRCARVPLAVVAHHRLSAGRHAHALGGPEWDSSRQVVSRRPEPPNPVSELISTRLPP